MYLAGVDEVGRGPLAGPVVAAAVILPPKCDLALADSKALSSKKRDFLAQQIQEIALSFAIAEASAAEIDEFNILQASLLAMRRAVMQLSIVPGKVYVDGLHAPKLPYNTQCFVKGDKLYPIISAASILAKVYRDNLMLEMDKIYPQYGFAQHKGYPTKAHYLALQQHGACHEHRQSFTPVKALI